MIFPNRLKRAIDVANTLRQLLKDDVAQTQTSNYIWDIVIHGLDIPIITVPTLTSKATYDYLCCFYSGNLPADSSSIDERSLYGLLHIGLPTNVIFLKEGMPNHIANYVIAHEIGHFLADIFFVKDLWIRAMPHKKIAIESMFGSHNLDPIIELEALIKGLPSRPQSIIGRNENLESATAEREIQADLIARELIAPWVEVQALYRPNERAKITALIHEKFGLPKKIAWYYYDDLQNILNQPIDPVQRLFQPLFSEQREKDQ